MRLYVQKMIFCGRSSVLHNHQCTRKKIVLKSKVLNTTIELYQSSAVISVLLEVARRTEKYWMINNRYIPAVYIGKRIIEYVTSVSERRHLFHGDYT